MLILLCWEELLVLFFSLPHAFFYGWARVWMRVLLRLISLIFFPRLIFPGLNDNHHRAEISVIWLVKQSAIKLLILYITREKQALRFRNLIVNTAFVTLFKIRFRSLLTSKREDNTLKLRQCIKIFCNRFVQERCF